MTSFLPFEGNDHRLLWASMDNPGSAKEHNHSFCDAGGGLNEEQLKESDGYKVIIKPVKLSPEEPEIRIAKAFGCIFEEIFRRHQKQEETVCSGFS